MKQIPVDAFTLTEVGGVGDMIYRVVHFPEYVPEYDEETSGDVIVPLFTRTMAPTSGIDYSVTGQELLVSLCNLYKRVNDPDEEESVTSLVWAWCRGNMHPYGIEKLTAEIKDLASYDPYDLDGLSARMTADEPMSEDEKAEMNTLTAKMKSYLLPDPYSMERLQRMATFAVKDFVDDLCRLGTVFEYNDALNKVRWKHGISAGRNLYYDGRVCESIPFLERYRLIEDDGEYLERVKSDYNELVFNLLDMFPDFRMRVKQDENTHKVQMVADIDSVFDIAWYTFARMVSDVAPPADTDMEYVHSQGSILTCMSCGRYFVRHSSRQLYCNDPSCRDQRNRVKANAYHAREREKKLAAAKQEN